jgi:hypothetical protein
MPLDERSRHLLYRRVEELMGSREATTLMELLPPVGWGDVATKQDLNILRTEMQSLRHQFHADMERLHRRVIMWTSSMVVAGISLAFAAGRFV